MTNVGQSNSGIIKEYTNGEVTIVWKPDLCLHVSFCWKELIEVFDPQKRPWVNPYGATTERIIHQVKRCPSGALTCYMNDRAGEKEEQTKPADEFSVEIADSGPLLVYGDIRLKNKDGIYVDHKNVTIFCRCGASKNQPFCDGSHCENDFG